MWKKHGIKVSARSLISCPQEVFSPMLFLSLKGRVWGGGGQFKTREGRLISNLLEMAPLGGRDLPCGLLPGRSGRLVTLPQSFLFPDHVTHRLFFHFILFTYLFLIVFILKVFKMVENCFPEQMHVAEGRTGQHRGHSV